MDTSRRQVRGGGLLSIGEVECALHEAEVRGALAWWDKNTRGVVMTCRSGRKHRS
jgi:hypothetical protein